MLVGGKETTEIRSIPPEDIENVEMLPADEETIARYGQRAVHGVMLITLRYDQPATFPADSTFGHYIASRVRWDASEPAARVEATFSLLGLPEAVLMPAAFLIRTAAGGVLVMKLKERSAYTVMTTGIT